MSANSDFFTKYYSDKHGKIDTAMVWYDKPRSTKQVPNLKCYFCQRPIKDLGFVVSVNCKDFTLTTNLYLRNRKNDSVKYLEDTTMSETTWEPVMKWWNKCDKQDTELVQDTIHVCANYTTCQTVTQL